jgi:hypothetical protein
MWSARRIGWFPHRYRVEEREKVVGRVDLGSWFEDGTIELDGRSLSVARKGFWNPKYFLTEWKEPVATALTTRTWRSYYLARGEEEYNLSPGSPFRFSFELTRSGQPLGTIRGPGPFRRDVIMQLDGELAPELRLFAFWLVARTWRRRTAIAALLLLIVMINRTR